jgi:ferritin-like metal-binding protein YciE
MGPRRPEDGMPMRTIEELFEHELKDIYSAERALLDALAQMADESLDREIKRAFAHHRRETQSQVRRLEKIFKTLGQKPQAQSCPGIEGLLKEKRAVLRERPSAELLEFYNVGASQKIERYEISAYEALIEMAEKLGMADAVELLEASLQEEQTALDTMKGIASEFDVTEDVDQEQEDVATTRR